ncbi:MAG: double-strand break repair helicase AddA [Rhodospirillales bacterium]
MIFERPNPSAVIRPFDPQRQAADPRVSAWVGASAGTGKTKVLTDRVLSLMLTGTKPHRILCLTFTRAAAAEMNKRIADQLSLWATMSDADLSGELATLLGRPAEQDEHSRARQLFARVLDAPGGMNIQTIHAFCQSLLSRFPLEAAIAPHFTVADARDGKELLAQATQELTWAAGRKDDVVADALAELVTRLTEARFPQLVDLLVSEKTRIEALIRTYGSIDAVIDAIYGHLGTAMGQCPETIIAAACADHAFDGASLALAAGALLQSCGSDNKRGETFRKWLEATVEQRVSLFYGYSCTFFSDNKPKRLATKRVLSVLPIAADILRCEGERLAEVDAQLRAVITARATAALLRIAATLYERYDRLKFARGVLDFNDLIETTARLLEQEGYASWVLYKLDGGIDHLLIDEAQDTSPHQWRVIRALTSEFFAGQATQESGRTVFAVGDIKQSIFSFQGADPAQFLLNRDAFAERAGAVGSAFRAIDLNVSFRSTPAILAAVDAVFAQFPARQGVALDGKDIQHRVSESRAGDAGLVEIWPEIAGRDEDPPEPWKPPVERVTMDAPHARLAKLLARRIRAMCDGSDLLASKGRSVRPGDIMILVRRRTVFVEEFVRACKDLNVPVSGVDRLLLGQQIAVMDLIALGRFVLLPEDDLNLAIVLKSPLVGLSEEELFTLAQPRGKNTLWRALQLHAEELGGLANACRYLDDLLGVADFSPPFEFFSQVLGALGGRRRLLARLGPEADEPIAEFLELCLQYQRTHPPTLEGFLHWLERDDIEIKRDLEQAERNAVRVMTVHGAKGLQAPIVFLPDTMQVGGNASGGPPPILWTPAGPEGAGPEGDRVPLWPPAVAHLVPSAAKERDRAAELQRAEYRRLLYVAMTRAEDRLYVCGWRRKKKAAEGCWYELIREGLLAAAEAVDLQKTTDPFLAEAARGGELDAEPTVLRITCPQTQGRHLHDTMFPSPLAEAPPWMFTPPPPELTGSRPLAPSREDGGNVNAGRHSTTATGGQSLVRGRLIHRLLQSLPLASPGRAHFAHAHRWLARHTHHLGAEEREGMLREVLAVMDDPRFAALFGENSLPEVELAGTIGDRLVVGRVDRLVVTDAQIAIVDYKTDAVPPSLAQEVPRRYVRQMAAYRRVLQAVYSDRPIHCLLLWTQTPSIMRLEEEELERCIP